MIRRIQEIQRYMLCFQSFICSCCFVFIIFVLIFDIFWSFANLVALFDHVFAFIFFLLLKYLFCLFVCLSVTPSGLTAISSPYKLSNPFGLSSQQKSLYRDGSNLVFCSPQEPCSGSKKGKLGDLHGPDGPYWPNKPGKGVTQLASAALALPRNRSPKWHQHYPTPTFGHHILFCSGLSLPKQGVKNWVPNILYAAHPPFSSKP